MIIMYLTEGYYVFMAHVDSMIRVFDLEVSTRLTLQEEHHFPYWCCAQSQMLDIQKDWRKMFQIINN